MRTQVFEPVVALAAAALLTVSLGACSSGTAGSSDAPDTSGSAEQGEVLPPVLVAPTELAGKTFEITKEQPLVINVEDPATVADWMGAVTEDAVAKFVPGKDDGSAQYNPGFEAVGPGSTHASVTSPDGEVLEFTITVP